MSVYRDHQTVSVQEMPEKAPAGQLPRSVEIILDGDLVDKSKPGDRVLIVGTYRCLPSKRQNYTSGTFKTVIIANNVIVLTKEVAPLFSARDVSKIKRFCRSPRYVSHCVCACVYTWTITNTVRMQFNWIMTDYI